MCQRVVRPWLVAIALLACVLLSSIRVRGSLSALTQGQPSCTVTVNPGESIQKAIDTVPEGVVICLAVGTWDENIKITKSLTLRGVGQEGTKIKGRVQHKDVISIQSDREIEVRLEDLTIVEAKRAKGLFVDSKAWVTLSHCGLTGHEESALFVWGKVTLIDSQVWGNKSDGLYVSSDGEAELSNSQVSYNGGNGVIAWGRVGLTESQVLYNEGDGLLIEGLLSKPAEVNLLRSQISGNGGNGLRLKRLATLRIRESSIHNNKACGILRDLADEGLLAPDVKIEIQVEPIEMMGNGADLCGPIPSYWRRPLIAQTELMELSVPRDYRTVQEAIDAIAPGGTITLAEGVYEDGLVIWKPLTLRGAGSQRTILRALPERKLILSLIPLGFGGEHQRVILKGLTISDSREDGVRIYGPPVPIFWLPDGYLEVELQDVQISNNGQEGSERWYDATGLEVWDASRLIVQNSGITENKGSGLILKKSSMARSQTQIVLVNSRVSGNGLEGISALGLSRLSLVNSEVSQNGGGGIKAGDLVTLNLTGSRVVGNDEGLELEGSATANLIGTQISENDLGLRVVDSAWVTLAYSSVTGNKDGGMVLRDSAQGIIANSQVSGNGEDGWGYGLLIADSAKVSVSHSQISGNGGEGIDIEGSAQVEISESSIQGNKGCGIWGYDTEVQLRGTPNEIRDNGADICGFVPPSLRKPLVPQSSRTLLFVPGDFPGIQEAVDAIAPGGTIMVADGVYETVLTIWKPLKLQGADPARTTLKALPGKNHVISIIAEAQGVEIEALAVTGGRSTGLLVYGQAVGRNLHLFGNGDGVSARGSARVDLISSKIFENACGLHLHGLVIVNLRESQVHDNGYRGISAWDGASLSLFNSEASGNGGDGIQVMRARLDLKDSQVSGNRFTGIWLISAMAKVQDSWISDNGGCGIQVSDREEAQLVGSNNWVWYNTEDICGLSPPEGFLRPEREPPRPLLDEAKVCPAGCQFTEVGPAIWAVRPGGRVSVGAGRYKGFVIVKDLTLEGASRGETIIEGSWWWTGLQIAGSAQVRLQGFQISRNYFDGVHVGGSARVTLAEVRIADNGTGGLSVFGSAMVELHSVIIEGNGTRANCQDLSICNGLEVRDQSQTVLFDSRITNNADWGIAASLRRCGYSEDHFTGLVVFEGSNVIESNNTSGNQNGMGNPGAHPWNRPGVPAGQVCLP